MVEKRFHTLRLIGTLSRFVAILVLMFGILAALSAAVAAIILSNNLLASVCWYPLCQQVPEPAGSLLVVLAAFLCVLVLFLVLFGLGEFLSLLVSLEENTRRTAFVLRMGLAPLAPQQPPPAAPAVVPDKTMELVPERAG